MILKLGGSVVTMKEKPMTLNLDAIRRLAGEVAEAEQGGLVIVHGGGSFGHHVAKEYGIADGYSHPRQTLGFSMTHQAMVALNKTIVDELLGAGVAAVSVSPSSFVLTENRRITETDFSLVKRFIEGGMTPVLFGDAVLDESMRFCILSGDQLAVRLGTELGAERIIMASDVDGIYTADPKLDPEARLIEKLSLSQKTGEAEIGEALSRDVTGGMAGKFTEMRPAVERGIEVLFLNALEPGRVLRALRGERATGTLLTR